MNNSNEQTPTNAPDRFCDLVMKGGITSGIVYPKAVAKLAGHYRFHSIGGTSAGAIAASITAAAEYQRRQPAGSNAGFEALAAIPDELGEPVGMAGPGKLLSLFQAAPATRRLHAILVRSLNHADALHRVGSFAIAVLRAYWPAVILALGVGSLVWAFSTQVLFALLLCLAVFLASAGAWFYRDLARGVVGNGFGICRGMTESASAEALTPWLHRQIQTAAGRSVDDPPLTFGDLHGAPGGPDSAESAINLQIYATNLSHGRPYIFPLTGTVATGDYRRTERLYFTEADLRPYLPENILRWMMDRSAPYQLEANREGRDPSTAQANELGIRCLPESGDLPVLFAARLSLSFPLLISAVPLYAINHDLPAGHRIFRRCWFSDGGISSNFPMHLFDGLVPRWPTFGISLEPTIEGRGLIYLPTRYRDGYGERWNAVGQGDSAMTQVGQFAGAIISAMQNWSDNTLARMPGVRDRVVRIRLHPDEGGLNLNMTPNLVRALALRGEEAAEALLKRYPTVAPADAAPTGWDEHRYIRLRTLLQMLEKRAPGLLSALDSDLAYARSYQDLIEQYVSQGQTDSPQCPPGHTEPLTREQADLLTERIARLEEFCQAIAGEPTSTGFSAVPEPQLRVRPPV